jgi:hypothetical protein
LSGTVRTPAIQVNEDIAWLGAITGPHDAAVLQLIHDARGAAITKPQAALEERYAGLLFAADDFNTVLYNLLVLINAGLAPGVLVPAGELLVDLLFVARLGLFGDEINQTLDLLVGDV